MTALKALSAFIALVAALQTASTMPMQQRNVGSPLDDTVKPQSHGLSPTIKLMNYGGDDAVQLQGHGPAVSVSSSNNNGSPLVGTAQPPSSPQGHPQAVAGAVAQANGAAVNVYGNHDTTIMDSPPELNMDPELIDKMHGIDGPHHGEPPHADLNKGPAPSACDVCCRPQKPKPCRGHGEPCDHDIKHPRPMIIDGDVEIYNPADVVEPPHPDLHKGPDCSAMRCACPIDDDGEPSKEPITINNNNDVDVDVDNTYTPAELVEPPHPDLQKGPGLAEPQPVSPSSPGAQRLDFSPAAVPHPHPQRHPSA